MKAIGLPALAVAEELQATSPLRPLRRAPPFDRDGRGRPLGPQRRPQARDGARRESHDRAGRRPRLHRPRRRGRDVRAQAHRSPPVRRSFRSRTGAPLIVTPTYTTPDGWRIEIREPLTIEPTGDKREDVALADGAHGQDVRGGDRGRAVRLAHVPAGVVVRIAFACPYAWDDPGGVQVHVRELAGHMIAGGHDVLVLAPVRHAAAEPWVRAVGRPVDVTYNRSNAPIDPRPWSVRRVRETARARSDPMSCTCTSRSRPARRCGPPSRRKPPWSPRSTRAPSDHGCTTWRRRSCDGSRDASCVRVAVSRVAERAAASRIGGSFEIVPNGADVARFADAEPAELGDGTKLLFVGRLDERKGFPMAVDAFGRLAPDRPELRLIVVGDGPERSAVTACRSRSGHASRCSAPCPTSTCRRSRRRATSTSERRWVERASASCWWRRWPRDCRSWRADIPGYDEVVTDGVDGLLVAAPRPRGARTSRRHDPGRSRPGGAPRGGRARARGHLRLAGRGRAARSALSTGRSPSGRYDRSRCSSSGSSLGVVVVLLLWAMLTTTGSSRSATAPTTAGPRSTCSSAGGTT